MFQITLPAHVLANAIQCVQIAISPRSTLPILEHVLLKYEYGQVSLLATNLEIAVQTYLPEEHLKVYYKPLVTEEKNSEKKEVIGCTFAPGPMLNRLKPLIKSRNKVKTSPIVALVVSNEGTLTYVCQNQRGELATLDPNSFPLIPTQIEYTKMNPDDMLTFDLEQLRSICHHTLFAAAEDDSRPVLTGLLLDRKEEDLSPKSGKKKAQGGQETPRKSTITFACANAFRFAQQVVTLKDYQFKNSPQSQILLPARSMQDLFLKSKTFPEKGRVDCLISSHRTQILFVCSETRTITCCRTIEGTFPNTIGIVAPFKETNLHLILDVEEMLIGMQAVASVAKDASNITNIAIRKRESGVNAITLFAISDGRKEFYNLSSSTTMEGEVSPKIVSTLKKNFSDESPDTMIVNTYWPTYTFNWHYLKQVLDTCHHEKAPFLTMHVRGNKQPFFFTPGREIEPISELLWIIMPMSTEANEPIGEEELQEYLTTQKVVSPEEQEILDFVAQHGYHPRMYNNIQPLFHDIEERAPIIAMK